MYFEVRPPWPNGQDNSYASEYAVFGVEPKAGNDAALIAVFNHPIAAYGLMDVLNFASYSLSKDASDREHARQQELAYPTYYVRSPESKDTFAPQLRERLNMDDWIKFPDKMGK